MKWILVSVRPSVSSSACLLKSVFSLITEPTILKLDMMILSIDPHNLSVSDISISDHVTQNLGRNSRMVMVVGVNPTCLLQKYQADSNQNWYEASGR